nr:hypothetical protein [uncultured Caproiciproducens sp.]
MSIEIKETEYENYGRCLRLSNGLIDVIVTIEFGPRIVRFGFIDEANILYNDLERRNFINSESMMERYGKDAAFYHYGGHRVWLSPEKMPETYYPDNEPVVYGILPEGVSFTPPRQKSNDIQLSFEVIIGEGTTDIMVVHSVKNCSKEKQTYALWALTMVKSGGVEVIPVSKDGGNALLPNRILSVWPYTDIQDNRLFFGNRFLTVRHDGGNPNALKLGVNNTLGWASYTNGKYTLVKRYVHNAQAAYPDHGCSYETYVCGDFVEMESLSPLYSIEPGEGIRHVENLSLMKEPFPCDPADEDAIEKFSAHFK